MKTLMSLLFILTSLPVMSQSVGPQDIEPMLQQMQQSGKITADQAAATRKLMQNMDGQKWKEMEQKAKDCIKRNPAAAEKIGEEGISAADLGMCN
jgi:hypothetical protein